MILIVWKFVSGSCLTAAILPPGCPGSGRNSQVTTSCEGGGGVLPPVPPKGARLHRRRPRSRRLRCHPAPLLPLFFFSPPPLGRPQPFPKPFPLILTSIGVWFPASAGSLAPGRARDLPGAVSQPSPSPASWPATSLSHPPRRPIGFHPSHPRTPPPRPQAPRGRTSRCWTWPGWRGPCSSPSAAGVCVCG